MDLDSRHQGPVSKLRPGARLLCLLFCSISIFVLPLWFCALSGALLLALLAVEGLGFRAFMRDLRFILFFCLSTLMVAALGAIGNSGSDFLLTAAGESLRLSASFAAGRLFYLTTDALGAREAALTLTALLPPWRRSAAPASPAAQRAEPESGRQLFALTVFLVLSFIPRIVREWRDSLVASKARGLRLSWKQPGRAAQFIAAYLRRLALVSLELPDALAARGFGSGSSAPVQAWRLYDICACILCILPVLAKSCFSL